MATLGPIATGYSTDAAIAMVRLRCNEPSLPVDGDILNLLNAGVQVVVGELGGIRLNSSFPVTPNENTLTLTNDIQDILSMSYSTSLPNLPGTQVYPMEQLEEQSFMDFSAGSPATGSGPPVAYWITQDEQNVMAIQIYPPAMAGYVNVYYRARPSLWTADVDTPTTVVPGLVTNLDSVAQEAVILWTCARVLENRGRGGEGASIFGPQYDAKLEALRDIVMRRTIPKTSQVRDVANDASGVPPWWP